MCTVITSGPTFLEHRSWVQALYRIKSTDLFLRCSWDSVFLNENTFLEIELLIWEVLQLFHSGFAAWTCQWTEICLNLVMTAFTFFVVVGSRHWKKNDVGKRSKHETMMRTHYWISFSKSLTQILKFCIFFFFSLCQQMALIKCFQTCSLRGDSVSSLGQTLRLRVVAPKSQLALFKVQAVLKAGPLRAML